MLDVGCGTGGLTFTLPEIANVATVTGIDLTEGFVEFARAHNKDPRFSFATLVDHVRGAYPRQPTRWAAILRVRSLGLSRDDAVVIRPRHSQILAMMFSR